MSDFRRRSEQLRQEAKGRCHFLPGSGFTSIGYPTFGGLYLFANLLAIAACGAAIVLFTNEAVVAATVAVVLVVVL